MSSTLVSSGPETLALCLDPASVYRVLYATTADALGQCPVGVYLAQADGSFALDLEALHPEHTDPTLSIDESHSELCRVFAYRDRPLGALRFDAKPLLDETWERWLDAEFAPALFRSSYLSDTLQENRRAKEQLFYLDEMAHRLGELDLETLLVNILELTTGYLAADLASITLMRHDRCETAVDWGLPHEALESLRLSDGRPALAAVLEDRKPRLLLAEDFALDDASPYRFQHLLVLPLITQDNIWGSINLVSPERVRNAEDPHLDAVQSGVALAATAVENALLLEIKLESEREQAQLKLGHQIQSSLIPQEAPQVDGWQIAGSSVSATMIGGDYLDYFEMPDGRYGMVVADVAGKGVPAGLIMTATRAMFRAAVIQHSDPSAVLGAVNRLLCDEDFSGRFVTAIFLSIDTESAKADYAVAGHDAPVIHRDDTGTVEVLANPALPLGLRAEGEAASGSFTIRSDDSLVMFTDGVTEAMNADREQFSTERLVAVLEQHASSSAPQLLEHIVDAIDEHCGARPRHDDTTLIVVRRVVAEEKGIEG
jgi:serine phosphatase RsbU (regulator of sigma subunit)